MSVHASEMKRKEKTKFVQEKESAPCPRTPKSPPPPPRRSWSCVSSVNACLTVAASVPTNVISPFPFSIFPAVLGLGNLADNALAWALLFWCHFLLSTFPSVLLTALGCGGGPGPPPIQGEGCQHPNQQHICGGGICQETVRCVHHTVWGVDGECSAGMLQGHQNREDIGAQARAAAERQSQDVSRWEVRHSATVAVFVYAVVAVV